MISTDALYAIAQLDPTFQNMDDEQKQSFLQFIQDQVIQFNNTRAENIITEYQRQKRPDPNQDYFTMNGVQFDYVKLNGQKVDVSNILANVHFEHEGEQVYIYDIKYLFVPHSPFNLVYELKGQGIHICNWVNENNFTIHKQQGYSLQEFVDLLINNNPPEGRQSIWRKSMGLHIRSKQDITDIHNRPLNRKSSRFLKDCDITVWNQRITTTAQITIKVYGFSVDIKTDENEVLKAIYDGHTQDFKKTFQTLHDKYWRDSKPTNQTAQQVIDILKPFADRYPTARDIINAVINDNQKMTAMAKCINLNQVRMINEKVKFVSKDKQFTIIFNKFKLYYIKYNNLEFNNNN